jgi:NAD-dependent aldehyde dehydrogenases
MAIASINPATGEKLKEFSPFDDAEIEKRLSRAEKAFKRYRRTTLTERAELLHAVSELLFQETQTFAEIITLEMGKLFRDSVAEIEKCARGCRFYAENGARFLEEEPAQTDAAESYVEYQPLGPVLAVMPWNFPFWQVISFCCARADSRQRRIAQARIECVAVRACH